MNADAKIEKYETLELEYSPIANLTIRHHFPPIGCTGYATQSLTLELLKGEQTVSLIFTGLRDLRLADLGPGRPCVLKILSMTQDQWEGIRYRVFNMEQDLTLAFYCADFEVSCRT